MKKVHVIMEVESIEKAKEFQSDPEVHQKRADSGVKFETQIMIPLAD